MDLDTFANISDIVSIPIAIVGVILVLHQLYLTRIEGEKEHLRMKNEMTLNAYSTVRKDLRNVTSKVRKKLNINDMFDHVSEEQIDMIMNNKELRHDVSEMLSLLNKFAVGIKHDIFNIYIINELSGKYFIKTHKQFLPYIKRVRRSSHILYFEYDILVEKLQQIQKENNSCILKDKNNSIFATLNHVLFSSSENTVKSLTILTIVLMLLSIITIYINHIYALPTFLIKVIVMLFVTTLMLIMIQLYYSFKKYLNTYQDR
ncbi:MAG: hypothetical protein KAU90_12040 [Sulfurovaceae bacterium]|nr:hypothetical protein [Sulfurovaceae bacterium]